MLSGSSGASNTASRAGVACAGVERFALHALHAPGIAAEQQADFVVRTVALVNAHFLPLAARKVDQFAGTASPEDCSSSERILPRSELPGTYGRPNASLTTGLSEPPISSEPLPAPTCRPVSQCISPSRISLPISFNSVWEVCALMLYSL